MKGTIDVQNSLVRKCVFLNLMRPFGCTDNEIMRSRRSEQNFCVFYVGCTSKWITGCVRFTGNSFPWKQFLFLHVAMHCERLKKFFIWPHKNLKQFAADFNSDFTVGTWLWSSLRKHLLLSELKDVRVLAPVVSSEKCYLIWSKIIPIWYIKKGTRYSCLTTNDGWCSNILGSKRLAQLSNVAQRPIVQPSNMIRTKKENINELFIFNLILGATKEAQTGRW